MEAALPSELPRLVEGLRLLNRADPFLEVTLQDKGEYVLGAAGRTSRAQLPVAAAGMLQVMVQALLETVYVVSDWAC